MDIKEIAKRIRKTNKSYILSIPFDMAAEFAEALISAYKAELLKEVGDPVLYAEFAEDGGWLGDASEYADHLEEPHALFTSDQVAAAIAKLEEEIERLKKHQCAPVCIFHEGDEREELKKQLATAQEEISGLLTQLREMTEYANKRNDQALDLQDQLAKAEQLWQVAQGRCDGLEEKLAKAEQRVGEWQPIETAPKDGMRILIKGDCTVVAGWQFIHSADCYGWAIVNDVWMPERIATHWMPLPKAPNGASS